METLSIDGGLTVWTLVTFVCLFLLLARFTFKPLKKAMDERETAIRQSIDRAEKVRKEAEALMDQNRHSMDQARDEARKVIAEGHRIVAEMRREAQQGAKQESDRIVAQARTEIDRELQRSLDELKGTVANLSVRIARQVVKEHMNEDEHARLADDLIERLKKTHAKRSS